MKKGLKLVLALVMAMALAGCGETEQGSSGAQGSSEASGVQGSADASGVQGSADASGVQGSAEASGEQSIDPAGLHHVEITIKDYGTISVELDGDAAPITVENFLKLAGDGFYDGLTFLRIISCFMIQGGDPLGNGRGGSDQNIKGEFALNGVENNLSHTRGAISMARSNMMDSASSQFFIVHEDSIGLDGQYACFGYVTEGIEVVDAICEATPVTDSNGTVTAENQPVIESIVVID